MPFPNFKLCHSLAPDDCALGNEQLVSRCAELLRDIEARFNKAFCLGKCRSSSKAVREALLKNFSFPTHKEKKKTIARGIYILFEGKTAARDNAFYVGVANDVPKRLTNHLSCSSSEASSLLYLLLKKHLPDAALWTPDEKTGKPKQKLRKKLFTEYKSKCGEIRDHLMKHCSVVIHPVPDIMTLHLLEAFMSLELKTGRWNSFRPH